MNKTLSNTNPEQAAARGVQFKGNPDLFRTIAKAWNVAEKWMKSTKAMEISGAGCLVKVTTQQGEHVAEALAFVPGVRVKPDGEGLEAIPSETKAESEPRGSVVRGGPVIGADIGLTKDLAARSRSLTAIAKCIAENYTAGEQEVQCDPGSGPGAVEGSIPFSKMPDEDTLGILDSLGREATLAPGLKQALRDGNIDVDRLDADELRMCVKAFLES